MFCDIIVYYVSIECMPVCVCVRAHVRVRELKKYVAG